MINLPKSWEEFEQQTTTWAKPVVKAQTTQREFKPERTIMDEGVSGEIIPGNSKPERFYIRLGGWYEQNAAQTVTKKSQIKTG